MEVTLPIFVTWDKNCSSDVSKAAVGGIRTMLAHTGGGLDVRFLGSGPWADGAFGSVDWYVNQARISTGQVNAQELVRLQLIEPWKSREPHIDLMLLSCDLTYPEDEGGFMDFVFGAAHDTVSVQSVHRFVRECSSRDKALACVRLIAAHEFGHLLGLVPTDAPNEDTAGGIFSNHCRERLCLMRQVESVLEVEELALSLSHAGRDLCNHCTRYLRRASAETGGSLGIIE